MPDREKAIKGLEHCLSRYIDGLCDDCPYMGELDKSYMIPMKCKEIIMRDALALLKEQAAVTGWKDARHDPPDKQDDYLVFIPGEFHDTMMVARYSFNREIPWRGAQAHSAIEDVLFWMPLPKVPEFAGSR